MGSPSTSNGTRLPLEGVRVVEIAGLAPAPFAGMILSDWGAEVIRVDRTDSYFNNDVLCRNKRSISISLKHPRGVSLLKELISGTPPSASLSSSTQAQRKPVDVLIEPFRPGVMERLGLGPEELTKENERLVYGRMVGFRRGSKYEKEAGHDLNYLALSGALSLIGPKNQPPVHPNNLLADFAGGGLTLAFGILTALIARDGIAGRSGTGKGQVVDCDMVSGARYLASFPILMTIAGRPLAVGGVRGDNALDGGAPFYGTYETKDGKFMTVGALEPQFYQSFRTVLDQFSSPSQPPPPPISSQFSRPTWPSLQTHIKSIFLSKSRDEWTRIFKDKDACVAPVLEIEEVEDDSEDGIPVKREVIAQSRERAPIPRAAPRLRDTPARPPQPSSSMETNHHDQEEFSLEPGKHTADVLREYLGMGRGEIEKLERDGVVRQATGGKERAML